MKLVPIKSIIEDDDLPASLYHYTDARGLHGILESNSLHATHAAYLNDSQELLYGIQIVNDELSGWVKRTPDEVKISWENLSMPDWATKILIKSMFFLLGAGIKQRTDAVRNTFGPFVTCLSESRDQLSQWRGYGRGGGYAIRFDAQELRKTVQQRRAYVAQAVSHQSAKEGLPLYETAFIKMAYKPQTQIPILRSELIKFVNEFAGRLTPQTTEEELTQHRSELVDPLMNWVVAMATRMKDPGFKEEKEYRIATFMIPDFFSPSDTGLVPRVAIEFDPSCVKEILIGPGQNMETRESSVRYYVQMKMDPRVKRKKYPGVEVNPSKTPYRGD